MDIHITKMRKRNIRFIGTLLNKIILFIVMIIIFSLASCDYYSENTADIIIEYQVPFAARSQKWNKVSLVEKDNYGRELYLYESKSYCTNVFSDFMDDDREYVYLYLISQKQDDKYVYCYNSFCYSYIASLEHKNNDVIKKLKDQNDWNKPLDNSKMTALTVDLDNVGISDYKMSSTTKPAVSALELELGREFEGYYIDCIFSDNLQEIFVLREVLEWGDETSENKFGSSYVFTLDDELHNVIYRELSQDIINWKKDIYQFQLFLEE